MGEQSKAGLENNAVHEINYFKSKVMISMPFPEFWRESEAKVIIAEKDILPPFSKIP
jgi:hypothetical protein